MKIMFFLLQFIAQIRNLYGLISLRKFYTIKLSRILFKINKIKALQLKK